ncbi:hypothetical protein DAPPUDRAFT_241795 [Daphnia pulex]|uniref:Uncharacterized protein n=1 Tax=Daphnia pulex TaxID=6669 RepID=E9GF40_DAPPU|nr:hypothetical protein DAPPUDRAFT_241795 [Daphnia pulex]|eukprot:EFX81966.1 hypothetical protein DAPPUDRAFT_241795 [Daphnia pulex]
MVWLQPAVEWCCEPHGEVWASSFCSPLCTWTCCCQMNCPITCPHRPVPSIHHIGLTNLDA